MSGCFFNAYHCGKFMIKRSHLSLVIFFCFSSVALSDNWTIVSYKVFSFNEEGKIFVSDSRNRDAKMTNIQLPEGVRTISVAGFEGFKPGGFSAAAEVYAVGDNGEVYVAEVEGNGFRSEFEPLNFVENTGGKALDISVARNGKELLTISEENSIFSRGVDARRPNWTKLKLGMVACASVLIKTRNPDLKD